MKIKNISAAKDKSDEEGVRAVKRKAVFLDRDGVINRVTIRDGKPHPPSCIEKLEVLHGVPEALERLHAAGFRLVVVTNQPDVGRGRQQIETVEAIHAALRSALPLDEIRVCYHDESHACACRKPLPGMILDAARENGLDLSSSFVVGDRWRDIEAGRRAGCTTIFIDYGYNEKQPHGPNARVRSLSEAAGWILASSERKA